MVKSGILWYNNKAIVRIALTTKAKQMRNKKQFIHVSNSLREQEEFTLEYELSLTPAERLSAIEFMREQYCLIKGYNGKPRLQRVIRAIKYE